MTLFGYARVSTSDQNLEVQTKALSEAGAEVLVCEKASGKSLNRPELERLLRTLSEGDTLLVWKLDRLGRSLLGVLGTLDSLVMRSVRVKSLTEFVVDTTRDDHLSKAMLGILAVFGQLERDLIRERGREGVAIAKAQGRMKGRGRPKRLGCLDRDELLKEAHEGKRTVTDLCRKYAISRTTYYAILSEYKVASSGELLLGVSP
jgi:DNA invertase Pin-like site-specific DNA recombinase